MSLKRPPEERNNAVDASYRAEDALRVPNAEPGFGPDGRGLHYVAEEGMEAGTTYAKAQESPTSGYPDDDGRVSRR